MRLAHLLSVIACFLLAVCAQAADLTTIDRKIAKEPVYQSKTPKYCLLVFGPEAKTRVWLVHDGDTLYVDRNGNGDLTEAGEKVAADKNSDAEEGVYSFKVGDIRDGPLTHKIPGVSVVKLDHLAEDSTSVKALLTLNPKARGYFIKAELERPGWQGRGVGGRIVLQTFYFDVNGIFQFGNKPEQTPIVHFGGPLEATLFSGRGHLKIGREIDMILGVGTSGLGPGTTTWLEYDDVIPEGAYPIADIAYPAKELGGSPVKERYVLKHRC